ncbi:hypothetical protein ACT8ZR_18235 [Neobacillus sp. M.A.Huq-85]
MKYEQIEELLEYQEKESKIFMPNEIYEELKGAIPDSPHIAFAYSYTYLATWIYRYAKHISPTEGFIDNGRMKEMLGYNPTYKKLDYLIKKNGVLDQMGYTETVKDFPTLWSFEDGELDFTMYSEFKEELSHLILSRKFSVKLPVKAIHRYDKEVLDGTYYEFENTHCIPFEVFIFCMSKDKIGTTGFYLYSYIKRMNDIFPNGWDVPIYKLAKVSGIPASTLERYMDELRRYNMITVTYNQEVFTLAMRLEERKACTYQINDFEYFTSSPQKIQKMKVVTTKDYFKGSEDQVYIWGKKTDIAEELLPY